MVVSLRDAYGEGEFSRSAHPDFRSGNLTTALVETLYIVDMYRGIKQLPFRGVGGVLEFAFDVVAYLIGMFHE